MLASEDASLLPAITFRAAAETDVPAVVAVVESAYRGDSSRQGWTTEADLLDGQRTDAEEVRSLIDRPGSIVLVADMDGSPVGTCHLEKHDEDSAHFGMFAVRPGLQGAGIGRSIVNEALSRADAWGCRELRMAVIRQREDLISWYGRLGFLPTGETAPFPYGDERFGRPRRNDLEFVVLSGPTRQPEQP